jgi:hypothetical protein
MTWHRLNLLAAICWIAFAPQALCTPRSAVDDIATIIENNYFDAERAREIGESLRTAAAAGQFDTLADPRDLASGLTRRLHSFDHHFAVTWAAEKSTPSAVVMSPDTFDRRTGYGFRRVEVLPGAIGYIDLRTCPDFDSSRASEPAREAADAALALVANTDAIIIDLRNNPGGSPAMAGYLVSAFTRPEADIYNVFHYRDRTESERPKEGYPKPRLDVPLYVLISGRTASAAESLAYTLQAAKRAVIIGEISGGAANPGGEFPAGEGFHVFVSISTPINAITGANWEGGGVKPDIRVTDRHALRRAQILALEAVLARNTSGIERLDALWTLEALRSESPASPGPSLTSYAGTYSDATISVAADGSLALQRGRRPPWILLRLRGDVFFVRDEPFRRVLFERSGTGQVQRFQLLRAGGPSTWYRKGGVTPVGSVHSGHSPTG